MNAEKTQQEVIIEVITAADRPLNQGEIFSDRRLSKVKARERNSRLRDAVTHNRLTRRKEWSSETSKHQWKYWLSNAPWPEEPAHAEDQKPTPEDILTHMEQPQAADHPSRPDQAEIPEAEPKEVPDFGISAPQNPESTPQQTGSETDPFPPDTDALLDHIHALPHRCVHNADQHIPRLRALADWFFRGGDDEVANWLLQFVADIEDIT